MQTASRLPLRRPGIDHVSPPYPAHRELLLESASRHCPLAHMSATPTIVVNGAPRSIPAGATLADVIAELGMTGKRIAVERNGEIVPRSRHGETRLAPGDRLEIVVAVGGG